MPETFQEVTRFRRTLIGYQINLLQVDCRRNAGTGRWGIRRILGVELMSDEYGILIHDFEKSTNKKVCIHVQEYKGSIFLSIREFYRKDDEWRPSPRGITVAPELYPELLHGIVGASEALGVASPEF